MKKQKHASPLSVLAPMFLLGGYSVFYLVKMLTYGTESLGSLGITAMCISIGLMAASIIINGLMLGNKKYRTGDEFTTKLMQKAGFISFAMVIIAIAVLFLVLQIVSAGEHGLGGNLNELIDIKVVLSVVAGIQIFGTFLFTLLFFIFSKIGDTNGI